MAQKERAWHLEVTYGPFGACGSAHRGLWRTGLPAQITADQDKVTCKRCLRFIAKQRRS